MSYSPHSPQFILGAGEFVCVSRPRKQKLKKQKFRRSRVTAEALRRRYPAPWRPYVDQYVDHVRLAGKKRLDCF